MKIFDAAQTRQALPFERLIPALEHLFIEGCEVPPRLVHTLADVGGSEATLLVMPAWRAGAGLGVKTVVVAPGNAAHGRPALQSSYLLHDARSGAPRALIDGNEITARRTAAASALAARFLARPDARRLLVLGAGRVARLLPEAYRCVRPITQVRVWNRSADGAAELAASLRAHGFAADAVTDLAAAVAEADIVSSATLATEPLVRGAWLRPGSHLDLIGGFTPQMREADDACFADASLFVDTAEALQKSGDLLGPMSRGVFAAGDVQGTLADLCRGLRPGRLGADERTVFKSVGTALEDLAAAMLVVESDPA